MSHASWEVPTIQSVVFSLCGKLGATVRAEMVPNVSGSFHMHSMECSFSRFFHGFEREEENILLGLQLLFPGDFRTLEV